jgi:hypothetical protein
MPMIVAYKSQGKFVQETMKTVSFRVVDDLRNKEEAKKNKPG